MSTDNLCAGRLGGSSGRHRVRRGVGPTIGFVGGAARLVTSVGRDRCGI